MTLSTSDFGAFHAAVHGGKQPFAWQQRLLEQIVGDKAWPRVLDLPTGAGKTTCIDIALFALALDARSRVEERWCPRRIAMVVDRRIVVDQVAERGRTLLRALMTSTDAVVVEVAERLRSLTRTGEEPLGVFTLRGGMPKDDGWARTPDQPLVIASTVDQVGSRMLMQGYGVSQGMKPVHAGLLANDTLLLLDEVHLSEPFRQTLDQLARLRKRFSGSGVKTRFSHAFLSATPGAGTAATLRAARGREEARFAARTPAAREQARAPRRGGGSDRAGEGVRRSGEGPARTASDGRRGCQPRRERQRDRATAHGDAGHAMRRLRCSRAACARSTATMCSASCGPPSRQDANEAMTVQSASSSALSASRRARTSTSTHSSPRPRASTACGNASAAWIGSAGTRRPRDSRSSTTKPRVADDDPIYGKAIAETVKWFKAQEKERPKKLKDELKKLKDEAKKLKGEAKQQAEAHIARKAQVDFGVLALEVPTGDDLTKLLAPKPNAPTLLPAYLDLWAQTSPAPSQLPDVSLWLHGPSSGPADVQVVWRADLSEEVLQRGDVEAATAIVAAVRPSSLEAMSLPFVTARAWLASQPPRDLGDTEGATPDDGDEPRRAGDARSAGGATRVRSSTATTLKPGHTIVVPATYGGIRSGCFDATSTDPVADRAEQANLFARARPVLRLHPAVIEELGALAAARRARARPAPRSAASPRMTTGRRGSACGPRNSPRGAARSSCLEILPGR